jgi:hypothetical protein
VPPQKRRRRHQKKRPPVAPQASAGSRQKQSVGRPKRWSAAMTAQDRQLVPQDDDLEIF